MRTLFIGHARATSFLSARAKSKTQQNIELYIVVEPRSTCDIEIMLFKLIVKVPVVGNTADTPNPPGLLPF